MGITSFSLVLRELLHEVQLEVGDGKEDEYHASQSQVVLPQAPGAPIDALTLQMILSSTYPADKTHTLISLVTS